MYRIILIILKMYHLKVIKEATGKALGDDIISQAFERIGVSTEVNEESVLGFAATALTLTVPPAVSGLSPLSARSFNKHKCV